MSVEDASASILPKVRKERKAAQIIGQHQGKSMEDLAKDANDDEYYECHWSAKHDEYDAATADTISTSAANTVLQQQQQ